MEKKYTGFVGQKFNEDGSVRRFPGNTVISKITPEMPLYSGLVETQERLKRVPCAGKYSFLPPSSLHMTVIEGLCDQVRKEDKWSSKLPLDMPLEKITEFVLEGYRELPVPDSFHMRIARMKFNNLFFTVLEPADAEASQSLKDFRDAFAEATGIRFPNHDTYTFHISLAYNLIPLTDEDKAILKAEEEEIYKELAAKYPSFKLRGPSLTTFEDMFRFDDVC